MGSFVVKLDKPTQDKLKNRYWYSDIDMLSYRGGNDQLDDVSAPLPMVYDVDAVKQSVRNILMWRVGESVLSPEFGNNLKKFMYGQINSSNRQQISQEIQRAIEDNEPRVKVEAAAIQDSEDEDNNRLRVKVVYTVNGNKTADAKIVEEATITGS